MDDVSVIWILVGLGVMVLGPPGAVWADIRRQVRSVTERIDRDRTEMQAYRTETQEELKSMRDALIAGPNTP